MDKYLAVTLIVNGEFKNMRIPSEMVCELAEKLRNEGVCAVHTPKETYSCEGLLVVAKDSKNRFMIFSDK